jgi:hypothetical protein
MVFFCIVDNFSKYFWLFPLTHKSDVHVLTVFTQFKAMVEIFFSCSIRSIRSGIGSSPFRFPLMIQIDLKKSKGCKFATLFKS